MTHPAVYVDHHATTPCDPAVVDAMVPYFAQHFGNTGSKQHTWGMRAKAATDLAREQVAELIGARPRDMVWTSGATESNNLAILGVARSTSTPGHLITCATEHKAVIDPMEFLVAEGWSLTTLLPDASGRVSSDQVRDAIRDDTVLVSLMAANNEIGVLHPIAEIGAVWW